jgi:hypothetical protein
MPKAFVDTTVLADVLLKPSGLGKAAKAALDRFDETELPVYAIKEFKSGPVRGYIWAHNALVQEQSFTGALRNLQALYRSKQRNLPSTAMEALTEAQASFGRMTSASLLEKYGAAASADKIQSDAYRLRIRTLVIRGWQRRRNVTTRVVVPLSCYDEVNIIENGPKGMLDYHPHRCPAEGECALAQFLRTHLDQVEKLRDVVKSLPQSDEQRRRYHALHDITRKPKHQITEKMCRSLGDAVFALLAPNDSVILTTNTRDHEPLASALGKMVERP